MIADSLLDRIDDEAEARAKKPWIAYALWFFTGLFAGHRWYLGQHGKALAQMLLFWTGIGVFWWLADAFLLPGLIAATNRNEEERLIRETARAAALVETSRREARLAGPSEFDREIELEISRTLRERAGSTRA